MDDSKTNNTTVTALNDNGTDQLANLDDNSHIEIQENNNNCVLLIAPATEERDRLRNLLERENCTVREFDSSVEILEHLQTLTQPEDTQLIKMLMIDWSLSDGTLPKLVRHLQQAPFSQLPLVALTDSPCIEINEAMMFLKRTAILQKPIKTNDVLTLLQQYVNQPAITSRSKKADSEYYSFLESNTLLELAIKNHKNGSNSQSYDEASAESLN